jgi:hypothetical protein
MLENKYRVWLHGDNSDIAQPATTHKALREIRMFFAPSVAISQHIAVGGRS